MKILIYIAFSLFYAVCVCFHINDALQQHEKFLHLSPAEQRQTLDAWQEQEEAQADHDEGALDFDL